MLASEAVDDKIVFPVIATPKLDGIRCLIVDGVAMSRSMKPIRNKHVQSIIGAKRYNGLDGELIVGSPVDPDVYRNTSSGVMSEDGEPDFKFYVFDDYLHKASALLRKQDLHKKAKGNRIEVVETAGISSLIALRSYEEKKLLEGYEGIMIQDPGAEYRHGRATVKSGELLKVKRFKDAEAIITGFQELFHNNNVAKEDVFGRTERSINKENLQPAGTLGALLVEMNGVKFAIGTGFTQEVRQHIWDNKDSLMGQLVKFKYFEQGYDVPRFPVFLGFRDKDDL